MFQALRQQNQCEDFVNFLIDHFANYFLFYANHLEPTNYKKQKMTIKYFS